MPFWLGRLGVRFTGSVDLDCDPKGNWSATFYRGRFNEEEEAWY